MSCVTLSLFINKILRLNGRKWREVGVVGAYTIRQSICEDEDDTTFVRWTQNAAR